MPRKIGRLLLVVAAAASLADCNTGSRTSNEGRPSPPTSAAPSSSNVATPAANSAANLSGPGQNASVIGDVGDVTRISFPKGATSGSVNVTLPPNGAKRFAVDGTYGQKIKVSADSKDAVVKMINGTDRLVESPGGGLVLQIRVTGDVIFEVRNASGKELNTNVRAEITSAY